MKFIYILDTSAIISVQQIVTFFSQGDSDEPNNFYTTNFIIDELKDSISKLRIQSMIDSNVLFIKSVDHESDIFIQKKCKFIGNDSRLSYQDKSILALAWQEMKQNESNKIILLTDDFEIQNTAKILNIEFKPVKTKGISYSAHFKKICQACGEELQKDDIFCSECGSTKIKNFKIFHNSKRPKNKNA